MMKCIYCNSETELTSSDIITYAVTGAKLTKSFVCKTHNAFTNDNYEKKFVSDLDFFRNHLGLTTRDGKPIQYKDSIILLEQIRTIDKQRLKQYMGMMPDSIMARVDKALAISLSLADK